jgi:hypothetical protein
MYKIIIPESESDAAYSEFEYLLGWYDFQGNWQQKLFTDWENSHDFDNEIVNKRVNIGAINKDESKAVRLTVEDAALVDLKVYLSMFRSEHVWRLFKDGTYEEVAPDSNSMAYNQRGIRFQFSFDLQHVV